MVELASGPPEVGVLPAEYRDASGPGTAVLACDRGLDEWNSILNSVCYEVGTLIL